jgi:hypothetical protein
MAFQKYLLYVTSIFKSKNYHFCIFFYFHDKHSKPYHWYYIWQCKMHMILSRNFGQGHPFFPAIKTNFRVPVPELFRILLWCWLVFFKSLELFFLQDNEYGRANVTYHPIIYEQSTWIWPDTTLEFRESLDERGKGISTSACTSSYLNSNTVKIWGTVIGDLTDLLVATGILNIL